MYVFELMYKEGFCRVKLLKVTFFLLAERNTLFNKITNFDSNILNQIDATITKIFLCDTSKNFNEINLKILNTSLTSKRSDEPFLNFYNN